MTAFKGHTFVQHGHSTEQIKELQHAIQANTRKLKEVQQKRLRAEEETIQCTKETERKVDLMMEKSGVVDVLQQLGHLLQQERHLSEQLNGQASADRNQRNDLQERSERVTNKARSLAAEILEVKQCLAEAKTRNMAAQALIDVPTSKSKKNQRK
ncbi:uncharacterized protein [Enoplosus armatus]|uniref:uncharacterized protein n=1 Tax=Enoplosus armatus TaxID=215367 RepID=UPI003991251B